MRRTIAVAVTLLATAAVVAGCGDKDDPPATTSTPTATTPTTTATQTPEEQAEAAAWDAYLKYQKTRTALLRKPDVGNAVKVVPSVATSPEDGYLVILVGKYVDNARRLVGAPESAKTSTNVRSRSEVVFDVCIDNSEADVVDKNGDSVVSSDHPKKVRATPTIKRVRGVWLVARVDGGTEAC